MKISFQLKIKETFCTECYLKMLHSINTEMYCASQIFVAYKLNYKKKASAKVSEQQPGLSFAVRQTHLTKILWSDNKICIINLLIPKLINCIYAI